MGEKQYKQASMYGTVKVIQISEMVIVKEEVDLTERMGLPQASIASGKTISFLDHDGSMFYIVGGTTVNFGVELDVSATVKMGYINNNDSKTQTYSGAGSSHYTEFKIANTGYYRFYVTNTSSNAVKVTGGTISF